MQLLPSIIWISMVVWSDELMCTAEGLGNLKKLVVSADFRRRLKLLHNLKESMHETPAAFTNRIDFVRLLSM